MRAEFGYCLPIFAVPGNAFFRTPNYAALDAATTLTAGRQADALGYDSLWVADHLMLGKDEAILEGWTTLAALAGCTSRAKLGIIHYSHPMRHPAMTAKMTATLDQLSGGRLIHFFDCGNNRREHTAYGLPWQEEAEERLARMEEALELTLALWGADQPLDFSGRYYHLQQALCKPAPMQQPHPPVWVGEAHPLMLDLCARRAQGWNTTPVPLPELDRRLAALSAACERVGRPFTEIKKSFETQILIAPDLAGLRRSLGQILARNPNPPADLAAFAQGQTDSLPASLTDTFLVGTPEQVATQLEVYLQRDIRHFLLWFMDAPDPAGLELFARAVLPRFR
ncbi:MAG: LLM class flavin-dependent oxidoreductase [Candidatus Latescibacteria bacterium]|nr:LLM class flavin-dependent oxidoreductase [Candidatus Latescibacterota bacterium]